ncbi:unnamed protein product [Moneuplotes crassus]|uniref:Uncharacterized protein n=1 Tax=Euplotes crassus TaxID=5936 RepID=A0AAD1Y642_EUPCR|nr:unnamed protein product [Moneuplotes crassus]
MAGIKPINGKCILAKYPETMDEETFKYVLEEFLCIKIAGDIRNFRMKLAINPYAKFFYWLVAGIQRCEKQILPEFKELNIQVSHDMKSCSVTKKSLEYLTKVIPEKLPTFRLENTTDSLFPITPYLSSINQVSARITGSVIIEGFKITFNELGQLLKSSAAPKLTTILFKSCEIEIPDSRSEPICSEIGQIIITCPPKTAKSTTKALSETFSSMITNCSLLIVTAEDTLSKQS